MSKGGLYLLAGALAIGGLVCLLLGMSLAAKDIRTHVAENYPAYSHGAEASSYECTGSPSEVADRLADYQRPEARATDRDVEYLRFDDDIVIVGPDNDRPCTIRVEDVRGSNYSGGAFIFLGPGFYPGAPAGGSGGSPGGPGGGK
ncbi:hypothetical protein MCHIJ_38960 [Mycolicibacterium chitae]|uniref:Conserved membrane protein of uncharacterized function n=2 Tax=Mycolicibacterium TaxID=1866885 RepID=A0A448I6Y5_MYCCI|nr:DUF4247 domain-containing protein [Mycolicibacterium chitae]MCV7106670.1 DUF4247 domain-containing protein [Mycolicibacterium chitae]BBZ04459.1 hypothetical protein MCHIJ_38960 [Mycolicibacterium chitae]VEG48093.1 Conserved membrane protein of uncharacterised function [Mycolicibacterium chitae]